MEVTLGQLKERWGNVVWGMDPYKGGDVPLLKIAEEDFEALEVCLILHGAWYTIYTTWYTTVEMFVVHCTHVLVSTGIVLRAKQ